MAADVYADTFLRAEAEENGVVAQPEKREDRSFAHSFNRAIERYGVYVSPKDLARVIAAGGAKFVGFGNCKGREIYDVPVDCPDDEDLVWVRVVYEPPRRRVVNRAFGAIMTVLPPDWQPLPPASVNNEFHKKQGKRRKSFARDFRRVNGGDENDFDD